MENFIFARVFISILNFFKICFRHKNYIIDESMEIIDIVEFNILNIF